MQVDLHQNFKDGVKANKLFTMLIKQTPLNFPYETKPSHDIYMQAIKHILKITKNLGTF